MGTPGSKFQIIQEVLSQEGNLLTVSDLCRTAGVSRSGYYNWLHSTDARKIREAADLEDFQLILIVKDSELRQSMSRRGNRWDNAPQESFFGHMKDEIDISGCERFQQVKDIIDDWMKQFRVNTLTLLPQFLSWGVALLRQHSALM